MCKSGDIIVIDSFKDERGVQVDKHSFLVLDSKNKIISNMMCSFHNKRQEKIKTKYYGNIKMNMKIKKKTNKINTKKGYLKIDKLYIFDKEKTNYEIIGHINLQNDLYVRIIRLISQKRVKLVATNI